MTRTNAVILEMLSKQMSFLEEPFVYIFKELFDPEYRKKLDKYLESESRLETEEPPKSKIKSFDELRQAIPDEFEDQEIIEKLGAMENEHMIRQAGVKSYMLTSKGHCFVDFNRATRNLLSQEEKIPPMMTKESYDEFLRLLNILP